MIREIEESGGSSFIPPHMYVRTSVMNRPKAFSIDAMRKVSLTFGRWCDRKRGIRRPEARSKAKASKAASVGFGIGC